MSEPHVDRPGSAGVLHLFQPHTKPLDVVRDPTLSLQDKRELLADWASDRRAILDHPALRRLDSGVVVDIDAVLDALKRLDGIENENILAVRPRASPRHRHLDPRIRQTWSFRNEDDDDDDPPPCAAAARPWTPRPPLDATSSLLVA